MDYGRHAPPDAFDPVICAGLFVGGCVNRGVGSSFRARAHAHNRTKGDNFGFICVRAPRRVYRRETRDPSPLLWHEYAHLLTPDHGHDDAWRDTMRGLGQRIKRQYQKAGR